MIHRIPPSRAHDDSKRMGDISQKFQNSKKFQKEKKNLRILRVKNMDLKKWV
jgi:hypothetical protein